MVTVKPKRTKVGGRKKGTPNKATAAKAAEIAKSGLTPLEYMLQVMRNPKLSSERRLDAAKSAAPYVHPKLQAIEHTSGGKPLISETVNDLEVARRVAFLLARGAHAAGQA